MAKCVLWKQCKAAAPVNTARLCQHSNGGAARGNNTVANHSEVRRGEPLHLGGVKAADGLAPAEILDAAEGAQGRAADGRREDDEAGRQEVVDAQLHALRAGTKLIPTCHCHGRHRRFEDDRWKEDEAGRQEVTDAQLHALRAGTAASDKQLSWSNHSTQVVNVLKEHGAIDHTIIVSATAEDLTDPAPATSQVRSG